MGFGSFSIPRISVPSFPKVDIPAPRKINPIKIPTPKIPTADLTQVSDAANLLTSNVHFVADETIGAAGKIINRNVHELAKLGKEALTGDAGYEDDAPAPPPGPGATGTEEATGGMTLLTGVRKRGAGRSAHVGSGSSTRL